MPLEIHAHAQQGNFSLLVTVGLVLLAFVYCHGWLRIRSASPTLLPLWRLAAFVSGLFSLWIALGSPLAALGQQLLTVHMMKHLLLMTAAAPLSLLGAPSLPLQCALPKYFMRRSLLLSGRTPPLLGCFLNNSVFCWLAGAVAVIAWHIPALFNLAMSSHTWHIVENTSFLSAGLLFWRPIVRHWSSDAKPPQWSTPIYLFLATLPCDILSAFLTFCDRVVYPSYLSAARVFDLSPLQDQECAGALMWVCVTFAYLIPAVVITMQILAPGGVDRQRKALGMLSRLPVAKVGSAEMESL
jgi:cytochrome c oxidase assembly factor CtaG